MIPLAVIGSVVIGLILLIFVNRQAAYNPYIVVLQCEGQEAEQQARQYLAGRDRNSSPEGRGQEEPGSSGPLQPAIPLLAVSALLLAAGLLAAFRYKR